MAGSKPTGLNANVISAAVPEKTEEVDFGLSIEMMVEVRVNGKPFYGVVKWMGSLEVNGKIVDLVGLEMVKTISFNYNFSVILFIKSINKWTVSYFN